MHTIGRLGLITVRQQASTAPEWWAFGNPGPVYLLGFSDARVIHLLSTLPVRPRSRQLRRTTAVVGAFLSK